MPIIPEVTNNEKSHSSTEFTTPLSAVQSNESISANTQDLTPIFSYGQL